MAESNRCPQCGFEMPADAPQGLCPNCVLKVGFLSQTDAQSSSSGPFDAQYVPPTPSELAPYFPDLEILELVGRGGMGVVYKARQKKLDRLVALKILAPGIGKGDRFNLPERPDGCSAQIGPVPFSESFAERFTREAKAMAMLNHAHIVAVYDFGQTEVGSAQWSVDSEPESQKNAGSEKLATSHSPLTTPLYYFIMEFVDGLSLRRLLDTGKLAPEEALAIVPQICEALQYAHDHGVVHRDIKPENVLMDKEGRVKIADFGIAKLVGVRGEGRGARDERTAEVASGQWTVESKPAGGENQGSEELATRHSPLVTDLTAVGQIIGTPQYMAPEQLATPLQVDHRADIYSLGVVFYQMLTGELPSGSIAPPSKKVQIDVRLDEVVLRALEKEPERRYQQASEMKTRVETIATTHPKSDPSPRPTNLRSVPGEGPDTEAQPWSMRADVTIEQARQQVKGPAIGLLITGILNWVTTPLILLVYIYIVSARFMNPVPAIGLLPALILNLVFSSLMIFAAFKMKRLQSYHFSVAASISAIIVTPGNVIGLPIGIWALVVLCQRDVRAAFTINRDRKRAAGSFSPSQAPPGNGLYARATGSASAEPSDTPSKSSGKADSSSVDPRSPSTGGPWQWADTIAMLSGMVWTSSKARKVANASAIGFLGFLGCLGFNGPEMEWAFGFSGLFGFFGLIGVAYIIEGLSRPNQTTGKYIAWIIILAILAIAVALSVSIAVRASRQVIKPAGEHKIRHLNVTVDKHNNSKEQKPQTPPHNAKAQSAARVTSASASSPEDAKPDDKQKTPNPQSLTPRP